MWRSRQICRRCGAIHQYAREPVQCQGCGVSGEFDFFEVSANGKQVQIFPEVVKELEAMNDAETVLSSVESIRVASPAPSWMSCEAFAVHAKNKGLFEDLTEFEVAVRFHDCVVGGELLIDFCQRVGGFVPAVVSVRRELFTDASSAPASSAPASSAPASSAPVPSAPVPSAPVPSAPVPSAPVPSAPAVADELDAPMVSTVAAAPDRLEALMVATRQIFNADDTAIKSKFCEMLKITSFDKMPADVCEAQLLRVNNQLKNKAGG